MANYVQKACARYICCRAAGSMCYRVAAPVPADFIHFEVAVEHFVPGETLRGDYGQERIGVKLLYVVYARLLPLAGEEHHGACHGGYAGGVAYGLHAGLAEGCFMATVVVDIVGKGLALLVLARYAAAD